MKLKKKYINKKKTSVLLPSSVAGCGCGGCLMRLWEVGRWWCWLSGPVFVDMVLLVVAVADVVAALVVLVKRTQCLTIDSSPS